MKKDKRSTVISTLFRSSRLVKLCKRKKSTKNNRSQLCRTVCLDAIQPLSDTKEFPSQFFFLFCLLERNEEQDLRGTYLPDVVLNVDVVY